MMRYLPAGLALMVLATCIAADDTHITVLNALPSSQGFEHEGLLQATHRNLLNPIRRMLAGKVEEETSPAPSYSPSPAGGYYNGAYPPSYSPSPELSPALKSPQPSPLPEPSPEPSPDVNVVTRGATPDIDSSLQQPTKPSDSVLSGSSSSSSSGGLSSGGKAGAVIGTLFGVALLAALAFVVYKHVTRVPGRGGSGRNGLLMNEMSRYRYDRADL